MQDDQMYFSHEKNPSKIKRWIAVIPNTRWWILIVVCVRPNWRRWTANNRWIWHCFCDRHRWRRARYKWNAWSHWTHQRFNLIIILLRTIPSIILALLQLLLGFFTYPIASRVRVRVWIIRCEPWYPSKSGVLTLGYFDVVHAVVGQVRLLLLHNV